MKVISKNLLKSYCKKLLDSRDQYKKELEEDQEQYQKDFNYAGQQFANVRRNERKPILDDSKAAIQREADLLIKNLQILNDQYIKDNFKAGQTKEYEKQLAKFMTLSGNKINSKIISFMNDNYDIEGLEFLYDENSNSKIQTQIKQALRELKAGDPIVNTMIDLLQDSKDKGMYNSGINVLCSKLDSIIEGAIDLEPFTAEEALEYLKSKQQGSTTEEEEMRYTLFKMEGPIGDKQCLE